METPKGVIPYLTVEGGAAALDWYVAALGATETARHFAEDGRRLMHGAISLEGSPAMLADMFPEYDGGATKAPAALGSTCVTLHVRVPRAGDVDAYVARAAHAGARIAVAPDDMFWGDRFATIIDPFGHVWAFAAPVGS